MSHIIAARLQLQSRAEEAVEQMKNMGFAADKVTSFYVMTPGQHAQYPIGGDRYESPGAKDAGKGASGGAAIAGAALSPVGAVIGGLVGAHIGSLIGTLNQTKEKSEGETAKDVPEGDPQESVAEAPPLRKAGMLVAVEVADEAAQH